MRTLSSVLPVICLLFLQGPEAEAQLADIDTEMLKDGGMSWSYCIRDLSNGMVLYEEDSDRLMTPASNLKIITTGIAMKTLGADFRYRTMVGLTGNRSDHSWQGDIVISGKGDPTLGSGQWKNRPEGVEVFESLIDTIKLLDINRIKGNLIIYTGWYDDRSHEPSWHWSDLANYFGIGARALNFHDNSYTVFLDRSYQLGDSVKVVRTTPLVDYQFDSRVTVGPSGSGDQAWIYGAPWDKKRVIRGTVPPGATDFEISGSVGLPEQWFARLLTRAMETAGIELSGRIIIRPGFPKGVTTTLQVWNSPALEDIVSLTNRESSNLYAEALVKTLGEHSGDGPTTEEGIEVIIEYLESLGIEHPVYLVDGSGLSEENAITTGMLTAFMVDYFTHNPRIESIDQFLPKAGKEGTVAHLNLNGGTVWLKSGTLSQTTGYSGIIRRNDGQFLSCSVLVNHFAENHSLAKRWCLKVLQSAILSD